MQDPNLEIDETPEAPKPQEVVQTPVEAESPIQENAEPVQEPVINTVKQQNIVQDFPVFSEKKETGAGAAYSVNGPSNFADNIIDGLDRSSNVRLDDTKEGAKWLGSLISGAQACVKDDIFRETLEDPTAEFAQTVDANGTRLYPGSAGFKSVQNENLSGERGLLRFMNHAGLGSVFRIPLWHTGMWLTLKSPSEGRLLELHREIISDKIELGRNSAGIVYTNTTVITSQRLLDLAFEHIYQTNLKSDKTLADIISCHDLFTIVWGLACTVWNNGFNYQRACSFNVEKCNHVLEEHLDVSKLLWVNRKALTAWQVAHMSRTKIQSITDEDLERYKNESLKAQKRTFIVNKDQPSQFEVTLKIPTIAQYLTSGQRWIGDIIQMLNSSLGMDVSTNERNKYVADQGRATELRNYIHWIDSITFGDNNVINEVNLIEDIFNRLSAEDAVRGEIIEQVQKYMNDTAISVIGIPSYKCPNCGGENHVKDSTEAFKGVIPIDVYQTFFTLLVQTVARVRSRLPDDQDKG